MPERNIVTWNAMISGYGEAGEVAESRRLFDSMAEQNVISWNTMMGTYAQHGHPLRVWQLFDGMPQRNVPDELTFLCLLSSVAYTGIVDEVRERFMAMVADNFVEPTLQHYCCLIAALARAGRLRDAEELIHSMPFMPEQVAWMTLLSASRNDTDLVRGRHAAQHVMRIKPQDSASYVLLFNLYSHGLASSENVVKERMK
ncbi:hypothetical protein SELMODRAFT_137248 [Selaginella moellendorffii]|uniref:Pentacotripeptide-repeat region of PRORP domain-containing protein n=1 Tax=Selaginella moellendorffii TaxID=88036 RepID=D8TD77_SELML|nr:hypothetical protein SELMODRAFT_137248 [Selaginella moellendorffii]